MYIHVEMEGWDFILFYWFTLCLWVFSFACVHDGCKYVCTYAGVSCFVRKIHKLRPTMIRWSNCSTLSNAHTHEDYQNCSAWQTFFLHCECVIIRELMKLRNKQLSPPAFIIEYYYVSCKILFLLNLASSRLVCHAIQFLNFLLTVYHALLSKFPAELVMISHFFLSFTYTTSFNIKCKSMYLYSWISSEWCALC